MTRRIKLVTPGVRPALHAAIIVVLAHIARPVHYRGVQRLTWTAARFFSAGDQVSVSVAEDTRLLIPLYDGYWAKLLNRHYRYEPEITTMLARLLTPESYFVDCGANIGYWSMVSRNRCRRVVAVEASPDTYDRLLANVALNDADIDLVSAALWSEDGKPLTMTRHHLQHAGSTVSNGQGRAGAGGWDTVEVSSLTLESILDRYCPDHAAPVVVKLDVEGAEVPAVEGSKDALRRRGAVLIYEDHGNDPECKVTRHLLGLGMVVTDAVSGRAFTVDDVAAQKTQSWRGYNFVAVWPEQRETLQRLGVLEGQRPSGAPR